MKRPITITIFIMSILFVFVLFFLMSNISYVRIVRVWYVAHSKYKPENKPENKPDKKEIVLQALHDKGDSFAGYYLAVYYKYIDIEKAIGIAEDALHNSVKKRNFIVADEEFLLHRLLGTLYFYKKAYEQSSEYYWKALQKREDDDMLRYNYELAYYFYNNYKASEQIIEVDSYDFPPSDEIVIDNIQTLPQSIEKAIEKAHSFQLFIEDTASNNYKPW